VLEVSVSLGKIYVCNVPWGSTEEGLKSYFSTVGEVKSVAIIKDRETGRSRGFGFIEMDNFAEAITQFDGKDFEGRTLKVVEALPQKPRENRRPAYNDETRSDEGYGQGGYGRR
jgi:RNA recognition motif-containing protein